MPRVAIRQFDHGKFLADTVGEPVFVLERNRAVRFDLRNDIENLLIDRKGLEYIVVDDGDEFNGTVVAETSCGP